MLHEIEQFSDLTAMRDEAALLKTGRLKAVVITRQLFVELLRQGQSGRFFKIDGMPADAVVVGFSQHARFASDAIVLKVFSEEFPVVAEACTMPELELRCSLYQETIINEHGVESTRLSDGGILCTCQAENGAVL